MPFRITESEYEAAYIKEHLEFINEGYKLMTMNEFKILKALAYIGVFSLCLLAIGYFAGSLTLSTFSTAVVVYSIYIYMFIRASNE